jgi:hypothetical protein
VWLSSAEDKLAHYLCCDPLWTLCASHSRMGCDVLSASPSHRLCLSDPSPEAVRLCGVACWLYHTLKIGYRDEVEELVSSASFSGVISLAHTVLGACPLVLT